MAARGDTAGRWRLRSRDGTAADVDRLHQPDRNRFALTNQKWRLNNGTLTMAH
jgi:hypothetical protein